MVYNVHIKEGALDKNTDRPNQELAPEPNSQMMPAPGPISDKPKKPKKGLKLAAIAALILGLVALSLFLLSKTNFGSDIASKIGINNKAKEQNEQAKIRKQFDELDIVKALSPQQQNEAYQLVGAQYYAAYRVGIAPLPGSKADQASLNFTNTSNAPDSVSNSIAQFIDSRLELVKTTGFYRGYIFYYWYGNTLANFPDAYDIPGRDSKEAYEADKKSALERATSDRQAIIDGNLSPAALVDELSRGGRWSMAEDPNNSTVFTSMPADMRQGVLTANNKSVLDTIAATSSNGVSDIKSLQYLSIYNPPNSAYDAGYYFVKIDALAKGSPTIQEYNNYLDEYRSGVK